IHQRVIALGAQLKQPLIHGAPVVLRAFEDLTAATDGLAQLLTREHTLLFAREPEVLSQSRRGRKRIALEQEKPAVYLRTALHCGQPHAQREELRHALAVATAELDPAVTDAARIVAHQQIPAHPLSGVGVGLHARRAEVRIEQQRQGEREYLGLARAIVPAQQQVAVVKPELLAVVEEEVDQAEAQGLPALAPRLRQRREIGRAAC